MAAGGSADVFQYSVDRLGLAIRAVAGQRVVIVGDRENPCPETDGWTGQFSGITRTVEPFVVLPYDGGDGVGNANGPQHSIAGLGMFPHRHPLFFGDHWITKISRT